MAEIISDVQIPLDNLAFTVEEYLLANGTRLDIETRALLAGIRDCAGLLSARLRFVARPETRRPAPAGRAQACSSRSSSSSARL